ncbi:MAG: glycosyltransferase family 2 protein [Nitrosomonas sp.]|nr:glycosyltransferase family 2 protein [Nitrosomonas sp.]
MISVILVNYHTARHTIDAVASVMSQHTVAAPPEIIIIDNSVSDAENALLKTHLPDTVTYIRNPENTGFANACNQAFAQSNGEFVLLLNPDARLLPGALSKLADSLTHHPDAGAVGPRVYWDDDCRFLMPPSTYLSLSDFYREAISRAIPRLSAYPSLSFRKKALQAWTCTTAIPVDALSGGHMLIRREAIQRCGGLFDPRFFMYWEDTDLMHRLKKHGYRLYLEPGARCLHYYEHSHAKDRLIAEGWSAYQQKHLSGDMRFQLIDTLNKRLPPTKAPHIESIAANQEKLVFSIPAELRNAWLLEIGASPQLIPAMGYFGDGPVAEVGASLFRRLREKTYFARLSAPVPHPDLMYYWQWQGYQ